MPRLPPQLTPRESDGAQDAMTRLGQEKNIQEIDRLGCGEWTILYEYIDLGDRNRCLYSGLLTPDSVPAALERTDWELGIGDGLPGFIRSYEGERTITEYRRFGLESAEPIVYCQHFHGIKPDQFDLSEEFRLFHNLYRDHAGGRFIHVDDHGNEIVVAEVAPGRIRVLTRFLRQYMAARQLALAIFFDHRANAEVDIKKATELYPSKELHAEDRCYLFHIGEIRGRYVFSRLHGKRIILPPRVEESGVWPFEDGDKKYEEFIIGAAGDGSAVIHSCDPDLLADYFGGNEGAPHYLTPVWFTRKVLAKYYNEPGKFSVEDGYLRCGSLWGLQIDNDLRDHVVVFLGDLGRDLSYEEQSYWRHFNVTPSERQPSDTNFRRSFLAQFTDPSAPDLVFKQSYTRLNEVWRAKWGWQMFRPLHESDAHIFKQLHVPVTDSLGEFENQIIFLVKLLIDSLDEGGLSRAVGGSLADEKGISKFKRYLESCSYQFVDRDIALLRVLQSLRSSGAAHAKGEKFDKVVGSVGLDVKSPADTFRDLLVRANLMLADLASHFG